MKYLIVLPSFTLDDAVQVWRRCIHCKTLIFQL